MRSKFRFSLLLLVLCLFLPQSLRAFAATENIWSYENGAWYHYDSQGVKQTGWQKIDGYWFYLDSEGVMLTGWQKIDGKWYLFAQSGAMLTGWQKAGVSWYYMAPGGVMQTGWQKINDKWYLLAQSGAMLTGWQKVGSNWYYIAANGVMQTGWQKINNKWYLLAQSGAMLTGWQKSNNKWYYLSAPGSMQQGWLTLGERTYYLADRDADLPATGEMLRGFHVIGEKVYCFESNGTQLKDWTEENVIVIDPGHSSEIPDWQVPLGPGSSEMKDADSYGTSGIKTGVNEYALVLNVSLQLRDKLEARGYKVVMVRTTNTGLYSCVDRAKVANDNNAAVFLRVHANSDRKNLSKTGAMTICITKNNDFIPQMYQKSRLLSDQVLGSYVSATGCRSEGVWERDDMIANNWSKVPTTLIELGYMSNADEDVLMQTTQYQEKMVSGMLGGIDNYFRAVCK